MCLPRGGCSKRFWKVLGSVFRKMFFQSPACHSSNLGWRSKMDGGLGHASVEAGLLRRAGRFYLVRVTTILSDIDEDIYIYECLSNFHLGRWEDFMHADMQIQKRNNMDTFRSCHLEPMSCWPCAPSVSGAHEKLHSCRLGELASLGLVQEGLVGFISVDTSIAAAEEVSVPGNRPEMVWMQEAIVLLQGTSWNRPGMFCSALQVCETDK